MSRFRPVFLALVLLAHWPASARAQYRVDQFTTNNGLPQNTISGIAQTPDGYLWIATFNGLVRYDGVTFTVFDRGNTPEMAATLFERAMVDSTGTLYAHTGSGTLRYRDGRFGWVAYGVATPRHEHPGDEHPRWTIDGDRLRLAASGPAIRLPRGLTARHLDTMRVGGRDQEGYRWLFDPLGIARLGDSTLDYYPGDSLFGSHEIREAFVDREGTVWVGTNEKGLFRLDRIFMHTVSVEDGLPGRIVYPVIEDRAGALWMSTSPRMLTRYAGGRATAWSLVREGNRHRALMLRPGQAAPANSFDVGALFVDRAGDLWIGTADALLRWHDGVITDVATIPAGVIRVIIDDTSGTTWVGASSGVYRLEHGALRRFGLEDGLPNLDVTSLVFDRRGILWVGTHHGLARRDDARFVTDSAWGQLAHDYVRSLRAGSDGALWIGTFDAGVVRLADNTAARITTRDGLFSNGAFQILEDDRGQFWISSNRGIYRVARRQLADFADGRLRFVNAVPYGPRDGMRSAEANGGRQPAGIRTHDGRLVFPTQDGIVVIDPAAVPFNPVAPHLVIERVTVDGVVQLPGRPIEMSPDQAELEIAWTAPSSVEAEHSQFRYRLGGVSNDWIDAGTERRVRYSHLPAGRYTFAVTAANADGVWNPDGVSLGIRVKPHVYETNGFLAVVFVVLLGVAGAGYQIRVRALKAEEKRLTDLVAERTAELELVNAKLQQLATEDGLTGLANRRRFDEFLHDEWQRSRRAGLPVSLLLLDVDDFKKYNDSLGHPAGDACLRQVAAVLMMAVRRGTDLAARFGGEEFSVVLSNTDAAGARILAESIRAAVEELALPHPASRVGPSVTVSVGCATMVAGEHNDAAELVAAADGGLYASKDHGRNRVSTLV